MLKWVSGKMGKRRQINLHLPSAIAKSIPHVSVSSNNTFGRLERHCDSHCVLFSGVPYSLLLIQNGSFSLLSTAKIDLSLTRNKHFQCSHNKTNPVFIHWTKSGLRFVKELIKALVLTAAAVLEPDANPPSFLEQIQGPK